MSNNILTDTNKSVLEKIFDYLSSEGFDVYFPGTKVGECKSKYIVIKSAGASTHTSFSTDVDTYDIICYIPKNEYSKLESFVLNVKTSMKHLSPMVIYNNNQTPSFYDDSIKAHSVTINYRNYKKL